MEQKKTNRRRWISAVCVVLVVAVMIYLFHDIFDANYNNGYETFTTDEIVEQSTVDLKAFIVRDEEYIDDDSTGTVVPLVADGKRVAKDDAVARVCKSEKEASDYAALEDARAERERFVALSNQTQLNALDMQKLNSEIEKSYAELLETANGSDYSEISAHISELENELAEKQLLSDGKVDYSKNIIEADKKIAELEAMKISPKIVTAPNSGYYISSTDGYENTVDYSSILDDISVGRVDSILKAKPENVSGKMGKIVGSYKWYIVSTIDSGEAKFLTVGNTMKINLPYYGLKNVPVKIEKISAESDGRAAIVLSCNLMNETYANMRNVDVQLVKKEYWGYKVPSSAIRSITLEDGTEASVVYILRGQIMTARIAEIINTPKDKDYVIVNSNTQPILDPDTKAVVYAAIQRYDEVIVKGRNLENGKSVG